MKFTPEELEEMRRADEEIERKFRRTNEELAASRARDAEIALENKEPKQRRRAEYQRAYREANRDSLTEKQRWIRDKRLEKGYTQYTLAGLISTSRPTIALLEAGKMKLDAFFAKDALCALLGGGGDEDDRRTREQCKADESALNGGKNGRRKDRYS